MILVTWNVQWCRGVDHRVDPARIVAEAKRLADFDVLCLQEVADNFPTPRLAGAGDDDQFARIAALLPGYTAIPGFAVDHPADYGRRRRFGNLVVSRLPVRQVLRHALPWPFEARVPSMPRAALIAGDFNFEPGSAEYDRMRAPFGDDTPVLDDAWRSVHPGVRHPTTFKLYEKLIPGEPELHCDFVFINRECAARLRGVSVDGATQASDHQPVVVTFE